MDKEAGGTGQLVTGENVERDLQIFRAHLRGIDAYDLAVTYQLTPSRIRQIVREQKRESQRLSTMNPVEVVEDMAAQVDAGISELARAAADNKGSVKVSAIMGRINATMAKGRWLQDMGILPKEATELNVRIESGAMVAAVLGALESRGLLTPELMEEIHAQLPGGGSLEDAIDGEAYEIEAGEPAVGAS